MSQNWTGPKYNLDDVANPVADFKVAPIPYDKHKGDSSLDGVVSIESDSALTYDTDASYGQGKPVNLNCVTEVDGSAKVTDYSGNTGTVTDWPRAFGGE